MAMCAPSEKFLNMGGPLACGFGLVFASSVGEFLHYCYILDKELSKYGLIKAVNK